MDDRERGCGCLAPIALLLIVLKWTGYIDWDWWIVLIPFWLPIVIFLPIAVISALFKRDM